MSSSVQFQPASFSRCDFNENPNDGTPNSLERDRANPDIYSLTIPYEQHIQAIFQAALSKNQDRVKFLFGHPLFKERIQAQVNAREPRMLFHLIGLIQELPRKDLQRIVNHILQFIKDNPQDSDLLPITLIKILKHPSLRGAPLEEILPWISLLSESPCSDDLSQMLFSGFWDHPSINSASKAALILCLEGLPNRYKIPFLTRMLEHPRCTPTTLPAIVEHLNLFNLYSANPPCSQADADGFYEDLFECPCMENTSRYNLTASLNQAPDAYKIPLLVQMAWHPALAGTDLAGIKDLIETFNTYYERNPCTELSATLFHSALFEYDSMSRGRLSPENKFPEDILKLLKSIFFHPSLQQLSREKFFKSFIEPAKGYSRMNCIKLILSSESPLSFTPQEFKRLCSLFLEELDPSDQLGPKEFSDAARSYLMSNRIQGLGIQSQSSANEIIVDILQEFNSRLETDAMNKAAERTV